MCNLIIIVSVINIDFGPDLQQQLNQSKCKQKKNETIKRQRNKFYFVVVVNLKKKEEEIFTHERKTFKTINSASAAASRNGIII